MRLTTEQRRELETLLTPQELKQAKFRILDFEAGLYAEDDPYERLIQSLHLVDRRRRERERKQAQERVGQQREQKSREPLRRTARDQALEVLGLQSGATDAEIKRAYRTMSRKYHPDTPNGDVERMKAINAAYAALKGK